MKVLGLMMVHNGEEKLREALDSMSAFCDAVYVLNDRSTDSTPEILREYPVVKNVFSVDAAISKEPWFFSESTNWNFLYRMADFYMPDWVVLVDHDEVVQPKDEIRDILSSFGREISGVKVSRVSVWNDPEYPLMIPLISEGRSMQGNIWRYYPGLTPGTKRLHNRRFPDGIDNLGQIARAENIIFYHHGWDTLQNRISKVDLYTALDPRGEYNFGVPYDRGLLFGYERHAIDDLIRDYRAKFDDYNKSRGGR